MNYEEKQAYKLERYQELSQKAQTESNNAFNRSNALTENIPFGQPILIGHHSEGHHRAVLKRSDNLMRKSINETEKVEYYKNKVENILNPSFISSDNPEAVNLLKEKIKGLESNTLKIKDLNSKFRKFKNRKNALIEVSKLPDSNPDKKMFIAMLEQAKYYAMPPDRIGAYYFDTTSKNAEIRRLKDRIKHLENLKALPETEEVINGITLKIDKEANRIKLFFPDIPKEEIRTQLKHNGFRWSPFGKCWQSYINNWNMIKAKKIISEVTKCQKTN